MNLNDAHILSLKIEEVEIEGVTLHDLSEHEHDLSELEAQLCNAFNSRRTREALNLMLAKENKELKERVEILTTLSEEQYKEIERLKDQA